MKIKKLFTFADSALDRLIQEIINALALPGLRLDTYADNTAAKAAGLTVGMEYKKPTGERMVVV